MSCLSGFFQESVFRLFWACGELGVGLLGGLGRSWRRPGNNLEEAWMTCRSPRDWLACELIWGRSLSCFTPLWKCNLAVWKGTNQFMQVFENQSMQSHGRGRQGDCGNTFVVVGGDVLLFRRCAVGTHQNWGLKAVVLFIMLSTSR